MAVTGGAESAGRVTAIRGRSKTERIWRAITLVVALTMAGAAIAAIHRTGQRGWAIGLLPLLIFGWLRPRALLLFALALAPFTTSLTSGVVTLAQDMTDAGNELATRNAVGASLADVAFLAALPGVARMALAHRDRLKTRLSNPLTWPVALYLAVGLLSFGANLGQMHGQAGLYFVGFLRTAQVVAALPVAFALMPWDARALQNLLFGYLLGALILALMILTAFALGVRGGVYILGMEKNSMGLALALAVLAAVAALGRDQVLAPDSTFARDRQISHAPFAIGEPSAPPAETGATVLIAEVRAGVPCVEIEASFSRAAIGLPSWFLVTLIGLTVTALACTRSRSSLLCLGVGLVYLAIARRDWRPLVAIAGASLVLLLIVMRLSPARDRAWVTNVSASGVSAGERLHKARLSWQAFRQNPVLGDGFRARRDFLPHNLELTLLAENGLLGVGVFAWAVWAQGRILQAGRRRFAADPLREWVCLSLFAALLAVLTHAQFDPYWRRGPLWVSWAGAGVVIALLSRRTDETDEMANESNEAAEESEAARAGTNVIASEIQSPANLL